MLLATKYTNGTQPVLKGGPSQSERFALAPATVTHAQLENRARLLQVALVAALLWLGFHFLDSKGG